MYAEGKALPLRAPQLISLALAMSQNGVGHIHSSGNRIRG